MPTYTAEYRDFGYKQQHHIAESEQQVREYYEVEIPWVYPVLILEVEPEKEE